MRLTVKFVIVLLLAICTAAPAMAEVLQISLGIRETNTTGRIGDNGARRAQSNGSISMVKLCWRTTSGTSTRLRYPPTQLTAFTGNGGWSPGYFGTWSTFGLRASVTIGHHGRFTSTISTTTSPTDPFCSQISKVMTSALRSMFQEPSFSGSTAGKIETGSERSHGRDGAQRQSVLSCGVSVQ